MRILFVVPYFAPAWSFGGPVKVVYNLSKELIRQGHEVIVATTDVFTAKKRHNKKTDVLEGIKIIYFKNISNLLAYRFNFYFPLGLRRWLRKNLRKYDIVHCHDFFNWLNVDVSRQAKAYNIPLIIQPHASLDSIRVNTRLRLVKYAFLKWYPHIISSAAAIITSNEQERQVLLQGVLRFSNKKTYVIPNGIAVSQISQLKRSEKFRKTLGLRQGEKMIIYFGRFQYIKGLDITIKALSIIKDMPFKYILIGRDEGVLSHIRTLAKEFGIADRLIILGPLFGDDLSAYLANADVFVFNSRSEGKSLAVLDACAAGLPVIISSTCNVSEVETFGAGIVLKDNTPEETARAITGYFSNPDLSAVMRQKCHQLIYDYFNLSRIARQYVAVYEQSVKI